MQKITKLEAQTVLQKVAGVGVTPVLQEITNPEKATPRGPSSWVRIRVMKRDRFQCTYCGVPGTDAELEVDHIVPVSRGGSHHMSNLSTACRACNQSKGARDAPLRAARLTGSRLPVGLFVLTFLDDGRLHGQGHIVGVEGELCLVQMFEWWLGEPSEVRVMPKSFIYSTRCRLYSTHESWHYAIAQFQRRDNPELFR